MKWVVWIEWVTLFLTAAAAAFFAHRDGGWNLVFAGAKGGLRIFAPMLPIFFLAFFIAGQFEVLIKIHREEILNVVREWMSGGKGILVAWVGGIFTPSSMAVYPLLQEIWEKERLGLSFTLTLVLSFALLNWQTLVFRHPLLGWGLTLIAFVSSLAIPPLVGRIVLFAERFFR